MSTPDEEALPLPRYVIYRGHWCALVDYETAREKKELHLHKRDGTICIRLKDRLMQVYPDGTAVYKINPYYQGRDGGRWKDKGAD